ncbi:hypothetical protein AQUCO_03500220v1 [Aquilegia coerulea]|uniref:Cytochrome P450 n=1 Tax=Aquilegia coerulea TaxID=218851 RepID=A0A2G5CXR7_AQUCA|nr:hypothetical protein AQUCO_03500220v1 [Aquilegia coerulea]
MNLFFLNVLLVLPVFYLILEYTRRKFSNYPPGPYPLPILGNFLNLHKPGHIALANLAKVHGPLMSLRLGTKLLVVGSSQAAATEILKINDRVMCGRRIPQTFEAVGKTFDLVSILGANKCNENWKMLRTMFKTELVSAEATEEKSVLREEKVKVLIDFLSSNKGNVVNIGEVVFTTAANFISNLLFSKDFISIKDEGKVGAAKEHIREMERLASCFNLEDYYPIFRGLDIQGLGKKALKCIESLNACWDVIIDERQESIKNGAICKDKDFLDALLANGLNKDQINWIFGEILITGVDTSSGAVEWAMAELIKNPEAMTKLREELTKELGGGTIVKDSDLPRLPFLNACVKETLRLHPTVTIVTRRSTETCKVMNYTIPNDSLVWVNLWALGRDPTKWDDPSAFRPSRFLESNLGFMGSNYEYLPFGTGRRMCPGLPLAARLVPLIVASLVHSFDWYLPDNRSPTELDMVEKLGITLQKAEPLLLIPKSKGL